MLCVVYASGCCSFLFVGALGGASAAAEAWQNWHTQKRKKTLTTIAGKTLFQIARENSIAGITTEQFAVAIFQLNPKAFSKKNINGLNKGQKIVLPDEEFFKIGSIKSNSF